MLIPALLLFGQLSDRLGRRRVIALGLGLAAVALVFFAVASGTARPVPCRYRLRDGR